MAPSDESPTALPLWKISRLPVVELTLALTLVTLDPTAVATSDNAVPPGVIVIPFMTNVLPDVTVVPEATVTTGSDVCQSDDPTCTQVLLAVFL